MPNRFKEADLIGANKRLKMLRFYPPDPEAQGAIMELLAKICPHLDALNWLVDAMTNHVGEWKGPMELRGLLCWRWRPADGIEASCSLPGFTPQDGEALTLERASQTEYPQLVSANRECRALVRSIAGRRRLM